MLTKKPLPIWPTFNLFHPDVFFIRAAVLYNAWKDKGVSDDFAVAMIVNAEFESAFRAESIGDKGEAFNLYQWHWHPRGDTILSETGIDVCTERDLHRIVDAAWWELNNTHIRARKAIEAALNASDAAEAACRLYEGAGAPEAAERRSVGAVRWVRFLARNPDFVAQHKAAA